MVIANGYLLCSLQRVEGTGVEGRQGTAVIRCGSFLPKPHGQTAARLWVQSPPKPNFFFQFMDFLEHVFFQ